MYRNVRPSVAIIGLERLLGRCRGPEIDISMIVIDGCISQCPNVRKPWPPSPRCETELPRSGNAVDERIKTGSSPRDWDSELAKS
jgi:hypothetical protein